MSRSTTIVRLFALGFVFIFFVAQAEAQTSRPRRVSRPAQRGTTSTDKSASDPLLRPEPTSSPTAKKTNPNDPLLDVQPVKPVGPMTNTGTVANTGSVSDTKHAYLLLEQKQFAEAAKEAKSLAELHPNDSEAWKIAGFAELNLKQYAEAAKDLQKAVELQRSSKQADPPTEDALAQAYVLSEKYQEALPLLVAATTRNASQPDPLMVYYRGVAEYKT
ncbi:MAG TPA: tetratricopeptide repeat protein, partial [Pyrinomonadaceae bacterium]